MRKACGGTRMLALLLAAALSPDYESIIAYDTVQLAPGVVSFLQHRKDTAVVSGNSTVIVGDDGVLVVDSGHFPEATRRIIADVRKLTPKPVRWVVNTHWHSDHILGNRLYQDAFPGVTIISTEATRQQFDNPFVKDELAQMHKQAADVKALLEKKDLPPARRKYFADALHELDLFAPDLQTSQPVRANLTFDERLTVHLGGRDAQVLFLGRGNTAGDTLVWLPDAKVLVTGDLVVFPAPYAFGSFFSEWGPTLRKAIALGATTYVPGHGPIMHDPSYLNLVADAADALSSKVKTLASQGLSLDDVKARLDMKDI